MTSLDKYKGGVPVGEMIVLGTMSPPTPASSTSLPWIDVGHFPLKEDLTPELEPARIEPSKLFLKLMERI